MPQARPRKKRTNAVMPEELRSAEQPARVLWLAGSELHAAMGSLLEAAGVSQLLPERFEEPFAALPDLP